MGQSASAIPDRPADEEDEEEFPCSGCLPVPGLLLLRRREKNNAIVFENYSVGEDEYNEDGETELVGPTMKTMTTMAAPMAIFGVQDPPPEDLMLTDVEDEEDEEDDDVEMGRSSRGAGECEWLPDYVAEQFTSTTTTDADAVEAEEDEEPPPSTEDDDDGTTKQIPADVLSKLVAVDCGMVQEANKHSLRRVCVVNGYGSPLLSALVRVDDDDCDGNNGHPSSPPHYYSCSILFSSLSKLILPSKKSRINRNGDNLDIGVPASQIKEEVSNLLCGKIVVGHSVEGDLAVLGLGKKRLPCSEEAASDAEEEKEAVGGENRGFEVRDTATYPPFMRCATHGNGRPKMAKLKDLVKARLNRKIQRAGRFHCCEEDAVAALDLYKSVWHEWEAISSKNEAPESTEAVANEQCNATHQKQSGTSAQQHSKGKKKKKKKKYEKQKQKQKNKSEKRQRLKKKKQCQGIGRASNNTLAKYYDYRFVSLTTPHRVLFSSLRTLFRVPRTFLSTNFIQSMITRPNNNTALILSNKRRKRKKRAKQSTWFMKKAHCDSMFLLCHCVLETWFVFLACVGWNNFPTAQSQYGDVVTPMQAAKGALSVGLVGLSLFRKRHRNDKASGALYGILAQYRGMSALVQMVMTTQGVGTMEDAPQPVTQHVQLVERLALALGRQLLHATPMAFVDRNVPNVGQETMMVMNSGSGSLVLDQVLSLLQVEYDLGGAAASARSCLPVACNVALSCWFALRAAKKV